MPVTHHRTAPASLIRPSTWHPKVRVPQVVLQVVAGLALVLTIAGQIPAYATIAAEGTALLQLVSGYFTTG